MEAALLVTDRGRITVHPIHLYEGVVHHLQRSIEWPRDGSCFWVWIRKKTKQKPTMDSAFILYNVPFGTPKLARGRSRVWLQKMEIIPSTWSSKGKRKRGLNHDYRPSFSLLNLIVGGFSEGLTLGIEGWSLLTCCQWERQAPLDNSLEMENNLVASDSCLSILKLRLCQEVVIKRVSPLPSCQFILQNFSSPFSNKSFLPLSFPRKI